MSRSTTYSCLYLLNCIFFLVRTIATQRDYSVYQFVLSSSRTVVHVTPSMVLAKVSLSIDTTLGSSKLSLVRVYLLTLSPRRRPFNFETGS